jgi:hypothetical protein
VLRKRTFGKVGQRRHSSGCARRSRRYLKKTSEIYKVDPAEFRRIGLTIWVQMAATSASGVSAAAPIRVGAILDAGSEVSGLNPKTAERLEEAKRTKRKIWTPTNSFQEEDALLCRVTFEEGAYRTLDFSIIKELEPYGVLVGRDLMSEMKLEVNFKTGEWSLSWA